MALALAAADAAPTVVTIDNFAFAPRSVTLPKGTTVRWVNRDDIPHLVVCTGVGFRSKALDTDDFTEFRFDRAGRFEYFCGLHPHMTGVVVVSG
jgi:plastocyanin